MIFAIYKWLSEEPDTGVGQFTNNKLYLASGDIDSALDIHHLRINDDDGEEVAIDQDNERFEYPEEVFGVIIKSVGSKTVGEVVVINDADEDAFQIKDMGFIKAKNIKLLDLTSISLGMMVYDKSDSRWKEVKRIDGCMRLQVDDEMRSCTDFIFAVSNKELVKVPMVRCLDDEAGFDNLTRGSLYQIKGLDENGLLIINDDAGNEAGFSSDRFEFA